jgi:hypothetical protein
VDHGDDDHGFADVRAVFVVTGQPAVAHQPSEGSLDHPPPRQEDEPFDPDRPQDRLDHPPAGGEHPVDQRPAVPAVRPDEAQRREVTPCPPEDELGPVPVLDVGRMDDHRQQQPEAVDQQMPLAAEDLFFPRRSRAARRGSTS